MRFTAKDYAYATSSLGAPALGNQLARLGMTAADSEGDATPNKVSRYSFPFFATTDEAYAFLRTRNLRAMPKRKAKIVRKNMPRASWIVGVNPGFGNHVFVLHATKGWRAISVTA